MSKKCTEEYRKMRQPKEATKPRKTAKAVEETVEVVPVPKPVKEVKTSRKARRKAAKVKPATVSVAEPEEVIDEIEYWDDQPSSLGEGVIELGEGPIETVPVEDDEVTEVYFEPGPSEAKVAPRSFPRRQMTATVKDESDPNLLLPDDWKEEVAESSAVLDAAHASGLTTAAMETIMSNADQIVPIILAIGRKANPDKMVELLGEAYGLEALAECDEFEKATLVGLLVLNSAVEVRLAREYVARLAEARANEEAEEDEGLVERRPWDFYLKQSF